MIGYQVNKILIEFKYKRIKLVTALDQILSLMGENPESVSTGLQESCGLHDVSDSNATRSSEDAVSEPVVEGALEIITDDGKITTEKRNCKHDCGAARFTWCSICDG